MSPRTAPGSLRPTSWPVLRYPRSANPSASTVMPRPAARRASSPPGWVISATPVPEGVLGAEDRVGHDLRGHRVADRLVVERSVGLDMGQRDAVTLSLPGHHEDLLDQVTDQVRARRHVAVEHGEVRGPAESDAVPVRGVGADRDPPSCGRGNGARQHRSPTGMRARGDVGRRDDRPAGPRRRRRPPRGRRSGRSASRPAPSRPSPTCVMAARPAADDRRGHAGSSPGPSGAVAPSMAARRRPVNVGTPGRSCRAASTCRPLVLE